MLLVAAVTWNVTHSQLVVVCLATTACNEVSDIVNLACTQFVASEARERWQHKGVRVFGLNIVYYRLLLEAFNTRVEI